MIMIVIIVAVLLWFYGRNQNAATKQMHFECTTSPRGRSSLIPSRGGRTCHVFWGNLGRRWINGPLLASRCLGSKQRTRRNRERGNEQSNRRRKAPLAKFCSEIPTSLVQPARFSDTQRTEQRKSVDLRRGSSGSGVEPPPLMEAEI